MKRQRGLSLVELMVAILISSLLLLGVLQLFSNSTESDRTANALALVQDSGRVAIEIIGADARRAGYQGCSSIANETTVGTLTFPKDALAAAENSVTFRYATADDTGTLFGGNKACDGTTLYLKAVTYSQCDNSTSLCMKLNSGSADPILDNTVIEDIFFGVPTDNMTKWIESADVSADELANARTVRIRMSINDERSGVERNFTGTYELRNRI